jgi:hypothetical protein
MADQEPSMDGGYADPEPSPELRDALTLLREHSDNEDFRALVDDVLAGRCSLIDASATEAFSNVVFAGIAQEFAQLSDDEKQRLATQTAQEQAHEPAAAAGTCGLPCATCTSLCALRAHPAP